MPSGAALASTDFCPSHQLAADPTAAQSVGYPEIFYEEPPAIGSTRVPRDDPGLVAQENRQRKPGLVLRPLPFIVGFQRMRQHVDIGIGGRILHRQPMPGPSPGSEGTLIARAYHKRGRHLGSRAETG